jgi:hypothetical protein
MHAIAAADERNEIARRKPILVHVILDRLDGVRKIEWIMSALPGLNQRDEHVEAIPLGRVALRHHQSLDFRKGTPVVALRLDWYDVHGWRPSNCLRVDPVVLPVRTDEPDVDDPITTVDTTPHAHVEATEGDLLLLHQDYGCMSLCRARPPMQRTECNGAPVGVILLISSIPAGTAVTTRCNVSSWYVEPGFQKSGVTDALRHKNFTYVNNSPARHTRPVIEAQGSTEAVMFGL